MESALERAGIVFMYAPLMHPAMRHVGPVRRELAIPTVMNVVGPLANPAGARLQVVGVADPNRVPILAGALRDLGSIHSLVVHGEPGLDEISPLGPTKVIEVREGSANEWTIHPEQFGFTGFAAAELAGGDSADNARIITDILRSQTDRPKGREREASAGPAGRAAVVLNAAAAIYVSGNVPSYSDGVTLAQKSLDAGEGMKALERLIAALAG
jgi:anthranilate phosphoribosyltransferase